MAGLGPRVTGVTRRAHGAYLRFSDLSCRLSAAVGSGTAQVGRSPGLEAGPGRSRGRGGGRAVETRGAREPWRADWDPDPRGAAAPGEPSWGPRVRTPLFPTFRLVPPSVRAPGAGAQPSRSPRRECGRGRWRDPGVLGTRPQKLPSGCALCPGFRLRGVPSVGPLPPRRGVSERVPMSPLCLFSPPSRQRRVRALGDLAGAGAGGASFGLKR